MRKIILLMAGMSLAFSGFSQVQATADIGIWHGGTGYLGDIENNNIYDNTLFQPSGPVVGAFFRYNFNQRVSGRFMFLTGKVEASGLILDYPWTLPSKPVQDLTLQAEINFLKYMLGNEKASFTSYLTAGIGIMYFPYEWRQAEIRRFNPSYPGSSHAASQSAIALTLPFGMGFKFNLGKRMGIGVEYQMRKIFDDRLDDLDDPLAYTTNGETVSYTDFVHNNDWAGFFGVHLTYKVYLGSKPCPAYDIKN